MKTKSLNLKSLTLASVFLAVGLPVMSFAEELGKLELTDNLTAFMRYDPKPPPTFDNVILSENIKGLVLVPHRRSMLNQRELEPIEGFEAVGIEVPGGSSSLGRRLKSIYLNKPLTQKVIDELKEEIEEYYRDQGHPLVLIYVPQQDITAGVLQIIVAEGKVGKIEIEGNQWTNSDKLQEYIRLKPDQEIDENFLFQDLAFINRNPFRRVDVIYAPGEKEGTTDVKLFVRDRLPLRVYAGANNTGVATTGRGRYFAGINYGNLWGADHIISYQYTTSADFNKFQSHTGEYIMPLPWRHVLDFFGGVSWVHPHITSEHVKKSHGYSGQASGRYTVPWKVKRLYEQESQFGFDYKRMNNTVEFLTTPQFFGNFVNVTQFMTGYASSYENHNLRIEFDIDLFWSPGKMVADQSNKDFEGLRPGGKNHWVYTRGSFDIIQKLPQDCSISVLLRGQWSSQNLLPSEQFGLGGFDTVRGYEERQLSTDNAVLGSVEFRTAGYHLMKHTRKLKKVQDALQFLAFFDYGYGRNHTPIPGEWKHQYLMGAGPGVRYVIDPYLSLRFDWGFKLHNHEGFGFGESMLHFGVIASY